MAPKKVDLYEVLGVEKQASAGELRKAYHRRALAVHPDKAGKKLNDDGAAFKALSEAYEILKDPAKRKRYDRTGVVESDEFLSAYERFRGTEVTEKDVEAFLEKFRNSPAEEKDVLDYCRSHKGDLSYILASIIGSEDKDADRYRDVALAAAKDGRLPAELAETIEKSEILTLDELDKLDAEEDIGDEDEDDEDDDDDYKEGEDEEEEEEEDGEMDGFIVPDDEVETEAAKAKAEEDEDAEATGAGEAIQGFEKGTLVEARWRKGPHWYAGEVVEIHPPERDEDDEDDDDDDAPPALPTYDILYDDDGTVEKNVSAHLVRRSRQKQRRQRKRRRAAETKVEESEPKDEKAKKPRKAPEPEKKAAKAKRTSRKKKQQDAGGDDDLDGVDPSLIAMIRNRNASHGQSFADFAKKYS